MPSQSTILLALVATLVLVMAYVAFDQFAKSNVDAARDAMKADITSMTREALNYYRRPTHLGGGGYSFRYFNNVRRKRVRAKQRKAPRGNLLWESENGVYRVVATAPDSVVIDGEGDHIGNDGRRPIWVRGVIKINGIYFLEMN